MAHVSKGMKSFLLNLSGFGIGLVWVYRDEMANPRIFKIPFAESFSNSEIRSWNVSTGPKGTWAVPLDEVDIPMDRIDKIDSSIPSNTW
jgi:hypothetical protein